MRTAMRVAATTAVFGGVLVAVGGMAGSASAATVRAATVRPHSNSDFSVWTSNVNIRYNFGNPSLCSGFPSVTDCPDIIGQAQPGDDVFVECQRIGQTVGGNPYWVNVSDNNNGAIGWMASYYINYPDNRLPVPDCG